MQNWNRAEQVKLTFSSQLERNRAPKHLFWYQCYTRGKKKGGVQISLFFLCTCNFWDWEGGIFSHVDSISKTYSRNQCLRHPQGKLNFESTWKHTPLLPPPTLSLHLIQSQRPDPEQRWHCQERVAPCFVAVQRGSAEGRQTAAEVCPLLSTHCTGWPAGGTWKPQFLCKLPAVPANW